MSMFPETDRASTWVALVMIGFMVVSVFVWIVARPSGDAAAVADAPRGMAAATTAQPQAQKAEPPKAAAPAPPAPLTTAGDAPAPVERLHSASLLPQTPRTPRQSTEQSPPQQQQQQLQTSASAMTAVPDASRAGTQVASGEASRNAAPAGSAPAQATAQKLIVQDSGAPSASALVRGLRSKGHRVHAAVSGDAKSTTLSVSGPTLTRDAGVAWLGDPRTRAELKAAGIRVVVVISGAGSWTFML